MRIIDTFKILVDYFPAFLAGTSVTLELSAIVWLSGILFGVPLGILAAKNKDLGKFSKTTNFIISSIPVLVFLFWLHYPAQSALGLVIDPFYTAALTFSLINIFGVSELVRNAINTFPKQYLTAALVCGLNKKTTLIKIQLPLILRNILPALLILQITMLHVTLFASLISVDELFRTAQRINSQIYKPIEIYTGLAIFFLLICLPINILASKLQKRYSRDYSER